MMLYNEYTPSPARRAGGALEIANHARRMEKAQANMVAELQAEYSPKKANARQNLLISLLTSLKLI